jgi:hypothetical protein
MNATSEIISLITEAFASESGPARCRNPRHCSECEEADRMLLDLDPRDLNMDDLSMESHNWIFSFATDQSIRWLTPGFIRVAMEQSPPKPSLFFNLVRSRISEIYTDDQQIAIYDIAARCYSEGWLERSDYVSTEEGKTHSEQAAPSNR